MSDTPTNPAPEPKPKRAPTLYFIIGIKALKGLSLLLIALGIYKLRNEDLSVAFDNFLRWLHLDPENKFFSAIGDRLDKITPQNMRTVTWGSTLYGLLLLTESIGLAFRAGWAMWLAVGQSAFFIPIEIRELIVRDHNPKAMLSLIPPAPSIISVKRTRRQMRVGRTCTTARISPRK